MKEKRGVGGETCGREAETTVSISVIKTTLWKDKQQRDGSSGEAAAR